MVVLLFTLWLGCADVRLFLFPDFISLPYVKKKKKEPVNLISSKRIHNEFTSKPPDGLLALITAFTAPNQQCPILLHKNNVVFTGQ